jgi:hypothetical protein
MGTTFVTICKGTSGDEPGFWVRDEMLALWLRLLALHLPEPYDQGEHAAATLAIRNRWLLASRFYFGGCTPYDMDTACANLESRQVVRLAIDSLMAALNRSNVPLQADTINLLAIGDCKIVDVERDWLRDIGYAFIDLLEGRITATARSTDIMPGSKPYTRDSDRTKR